MTTKKREESNVAHPCRPSHVTMTRPGLGSPLEINIQPSTYMYFPFLLAQSTLSGTVDVTVHGETEINLKGTANTADWTPFGMSSVKRGDWALLAVAFSITELLSALTTAETPRTSDKSIESWRRRSTFFPYGRKSRTRSFICSW